MLPMIGAGKTYIQDCNITFVESGIQTLNIQYKYSDANGSEHVLECGEYQVNVTDTIVTSAENMVSVEQVGNVNTFMMSIVLIVASLIAIVVAVAVYIKKYR